MNVHSILYDKSETPKELSKEDNSRKRLKEIEERRKALMKIWEVIDEDEDEDEEEDKAAKNVNGDEINNADKDGYPQIITDELAKQDIILSKTQEYNLDNGTNEDY